MNGAIAIQFVESGTRYVILPIKEYRRSGAVFMVGDVNGTHILSAADIRGSWNAWVGELIDDEQIVDVVPDGMEVF